MERVFHIFDKDDNGSISLQEFIDAMHQFAGQSPDDKIKFLFKVYDIDGKPKAQSKLIAELFMYDDPTGSQSWSSSAKNAAQKMFLKFMTRKHCMKKWWNPVPNE